MSNYTKIIVVIGMTHSVIQYCIGPIWNKLSIAVKSASTLTEVKGELKHCELIGCQCQSCI